MSATVERPVTAAATLQPPPAFARAEGLELVGEVPGSGYKEGAARVRRADGQMVQLGPLMYTLLEAVDGARDHVAVAAAMSDRLGRRVEREHVVRLGEKACAQGLLAGSENNAPPRMNPLLALRWKVLVTDPNVTDRITGPFKHLFRPWVLLPVLAGFVAVFWFVGLHKGVASATAQAFQSPELLLLILGLTVASAAFHEIGHAAACRYGGGRPGGIGAGIYLVWPAFYTDVTDAYRLPRRARLRTDLGGLYFNAIIAVVTLAVWWAVRADALLLLVALQVLEMVKQLSPVIRADGYHILSDATGVPDLYAHIGPTLRRLLPWGRRAPSALTGRARALVTVWVLVIVPLLAAMSLTAILVLPRLAASTWESGSQIVAAIPDQGDVLSVLASIVRLFGLALPVMGVALMAIRLVRRSALKANAWSAGHPARRAAVGLASVALAGVLTWAWWPAGQYQPVRASDRGTLVSATGLLAAPGRAAPADAAATPPPQLAPGRHLAVALIPSGGASPEHPAIFVVKDRSDKPVVLVSPTAPRTDTAPAFAGGTAAAAPTATPVAGATPTAPAPATALPFILPDPPGPNDSQALAVNTQDGSIKYDIAYSLVVVNDGAEVDETNSAYALASCKACTTFAVSFQLVLIVGRSDTIMPINVAEALNVNCPSCVTTAIADQIVVTLKAQPSDELLAALTAELKKLDGISDLGGSPADVAQAVFRVQHEIERQLAHSGLHSNPKPTASPTPTASPSPSPSPSATPSASPTRTPGATTAPSPSATPTPSATATTTPSPTSIVSPSATPTPTP